MYTLSITGPIGSGKSSLIKSLSKKFKSKIIPEFIDGDPIFGLEMLKRFIDNKISSLTFQSYILDYYSSVCNFESNSNTEITLIEKLPYDSVYCFGKVALENKQLTEKEFSVLVDKLEKLNLNLPTYGSLIVLEKDTHDNILTKAINIIKNDISKGITKRAIYLKCDLETCKERISIRNRSGEENYTDEYLNQIVNFYYTLLPE